MTSKSITARENRRRQKLRQRRTRADVRKVHRYGFSRRNAYGKGPKVNGPRNRLRAACGKFVTDIARHHDGVPYAVPDDAFIALPKTVQCEPCRWAGWPSTTFVPIHKRSGTHEHLMAVELLVAMLQRMWQARLEVGHRCYVSLVPRDMIDGGEGREAAGYTFCTCDGEPRWLDARTSYCPPRLCPERAAWEAYYGMPYEQLPSQVDRRWAPSPGTIQRLLAAKPGEP